MPTHSDTGHDPHLHYLHANYPEEIAAQFTQFNAQITQLTPGRLNARALAISLGRLTQYSIECGQATLAQCRSPQNKVSVMLFSSLGGSAHWRGEPYTERNLIFCEPGAEMVNRSPAGWHGHLITYDAEQFHAHLSATTPNIAEISSCVLEPVPEQIDLARRCAEQVRLTALEHPRLLGRDRLRALMENDLFEHILEALRGAFPAPGTRPRAASRASALKRAEELVEARCGEPLSVAELCRHAGVSARTLEYAFVDRYGIGPKAFIKAQRLQRVRQSLLAAPAGATVFEVAAEWGFWHMGQFSHDYKKMFAELPSETLRRIHRSRAEDAA